MQSSRALLLPGLALVIVACSGESPTRPETLLSVTASAPQLEIAAAVQGRRSRGFEDEILRMEAQVAGLGGVWVDEAGTPVVYLKDLSRRSEAMQALRLFASSLPVGASFRSKLGAEGSTAVLQGQFGFSELVAWSRSIAASLRAPGFLSIDADEAQNRVHITTTKGAPREPFLRGIGALGIPESAIVFSESVPFVSATSLQDRYRPTGGGQQIVTGTILCSLAFNVDVQFYAEEGFLTASHCSGSFSGSTGASVYQNNVGIGNLIGTTSLNPAWDRTDSDCRGASLCTDADAMYVHSSDSTSPNWSKRIYSTSTWGSSNNPGSLTISAYWPGIWVFPYSPWVGMTAYKVGRTTGVTSGTVAATCENPMLDSLTVPKVVLCADRATGASWGPGDSGGPVFYPAAQTDPPYAIGIFFGGKGSAFNGSNQCTSGCEILFSEWSSVQWHLSRYFSP
ncbi:MAG: trypsin-like serine protease [bacterium]